jgi:hypothetical protein
MADCRWPAGIGRCIFILSAASILAAEFMQWGLHTSSRGIKWHEHKANRASPCTVEDKRESRKLGNIMLWAFMWHEIKVRDDVEVTATDSLRASGLKISSNKYIINK